jgi:hypothetical protein
VSENRAAPLKYLDADVPTRRTGKSIRRAWVLGLAIGIFLFLVVLCMGIGWSGVSEHHAEFAASIDSPAPHVDGYSLECPLGELLGLEVEKTEEVRPVLDTARKEYLAIEAKHTKHKEDEAGHQIAIVEPFPRELSQLEDRVWSRLDGILDEVQQAEARSHWPLSSIFPFGRDKGTVEIWREGTWYHWVVKKEPAAGSGGTSSASVQQSKGPRLPKELEHLWTAAR